VPFDFSYEPQVIRNGSKARPPEILHSSWDLSLTGPFDYSQDYDRASNPSRSTKSQTRLRAEGLRNIVKQATIDQVVTPLAVQAYAELHLQRDDGGPIVAAAHHKLWLELLCDEEIKKLLIIAPPESAKTTWSILAYLGCYIGVFPERNVMIASATADLAGKRALALRAPVTTQHWQATFPGVKPIYAQDGGLSWGTTEWSLAPDGKPFPGRLHPTISSYGTNGTIEGGRGDIVLGDDLLNDKTSRSEAWREQTLHWAHASFLSRRKSRIGRAIVIGTSWHPEDYLANIREAGDWVVCHIPLLASREPFTATLTYPDSFEGERLGEPVAKASELRAVA